MSRGEETAAVWLINVDLNVNFSFFFFFYAQDNRTLLRLRFFGFSVNSLTKFKIRF